MNRWRQVVMFADRVVFWRGLADANAGRSYSLTAARRQRIEKLLAGVTTPAQDGQAWIWSWDDWNWREA